MNHKDFNKQLTVERNCESEIQNYEIFKKVFYVVRLQC